MRILASSRSFSAIVFRVQPASTQRAMWSFHGSRLTLWRGMATKELGNWDSGGRTISEALDGSEKRAIQMYNCVMFPYPLLSTLVKDRHVTCEL